MPITTTTWGYVCDTPRLSGAVQERRLKAAGIKEIHVEGARTGYKFQVASRSIEKLLRMVLSGDTIAVYRLSVLAPPGLGRHGKLVKRMAEIKARGVIVHELSTGLITSKNGDYDKMLAAAMDDLTRFKAVKPSGRPRREYEPEEVKIIKNRWKSAEHETDALALAAMHEDGLPTTWTLSTIRHAKKPDGSLLFGPSGRPYKRKSRKK